MKGRAPNRLTGLSILKFRIEEGLSILNQAQELGIDCSVYDDATLRLLLHFPASSPALCALLHAISPLDPSILDSLISTLPASLVNEFFDRVKNFHNSIKPPIVDQSQQHRQQQSGAVEYDPSSLSAANAIAATLTEQLRKHIEFCSSLKQQGGVAGEFWTKWLLSTPEKVALFGLVTELPASVQNLIVHSIILQIDPSVGENDIVMSWLASKLASIIVATARELKSFPSRQNSLNDDPEEQCRLSRLQKNIKLLKNISHLYIKYFASTDVAVPLREKLFTTLIDIHREDQKRILKLFSEQRPNPTILLNVLDALSLAGINYTFISTEFILNGKIGVRDF